MINVIIEECIKYHRTTGKKGTMSREIGKASPRQWYLFVLGLNHSFNKYLLSTYYVLGIILGTKTIEISKTDKIPWWKETSVEMCAENATFCVEKKKRWGRVEDKS